MFRHDPKARIEGAHYVDKVRLPPRFLAERFGRPRRVDGYKVSGMYTFVGDGGELFTVYDWHETTLYWGEDSGWPTPRDFWDGREPATLHIGGRGEENGDGANPTATRFREWLMEQYRGYSSGLVN